ncbi:MAG: YihY/virulence factor BrkB family protein [Lachnospiraceae bacterium]|nr:YihY/virulence factor BrkB family protein [Lachnospiraceae bacterium]
MIWKLIFNVAKFMKECKEDKINAYAAQSAFFILLAIIPFLMVFLSLLKYTPITESMLLALYEEGLPGYISPFFISITDEIYTRSFGITAVSAIVAIWSAAKGMHALTDGLNAVNDLEENRNWFVLRFWSAIYTVVFMVAIVFTLMVVVFGNSIRTLAVDYLPILRDLSVVLSSFRGLLLFAVLVVFFDVVFTVLPNTKINFISQLPGAVLCALSWNVISFLLSVYINYFNGFSMYGSLTTVALMMLWLYFCIYSTLMCAEFNVTFGDNLKKWANRHRKI